MDVVDVSPRHLSHTDPEGSQPQNQQERERRNPWAEACFQARRALKNLRYGGGKMASGWLLLEDPFETLLIRG